MVPRPPLDTNRRGVRKHKFCADHIWCCPTSVATAVSYNTPVIIVVMNNGVLGMVRQWQTLFYDRHYSNTVLNRKTDFAALAKAFGADGEAVDTVEQLDAALDKAFSQDGPYVIDCRIDKDEFVLPMLPPGGSMDDIIVKLEVEP